MVMFMDYDDRSFGYRLFVLSGKFFRSIWTVFLTIVLIITIFYGIVLNTFNSQGVAIIVCVILLGVIMFLSMMDISEEKTRFSESNKKNGVSISRASLKRK